MGLDLVVSQSVPTLILGEALTLVSWWKPLLFVPPFVAWAWIISSVLDKHAAKYYLERERWNFIHSGAAIVALAAAIFMPPIGEGGSLTWVISLVVFSLALLASVGAYIASANKDERVPANGRVTMDFIKSAIGSTDKPGKKKAGKAKAGTPSLVLRRPDKSAVEIPEPDAPDYELRLAAEAMAIKAFDNRSSRVELLQNTKETFQTVFHVDGMKVPGETMPAATGVKLIDFWKAAAKLDVSDRRKKQAGDVTIERGTVKNKFHLETVGGQAGQRLTIIIDPEQQVRKTAEQIGWTPEQTDLIKSWTNQRGGAILLAGMPEGGRTTTLYTLLKIHDAYTNNVQTVETEIEDGVEGVRQNRWDAQAEGPDFATLVRSILRRDPDVVALSDVPDAQTAKEVLKADQEKCRVWCSIQADGAVGAIQQWMKLVGDAEATANSVRGVIAEKLIRKLCINCKQAYQPAPDVLKKLGLPADKVKQLFKKGGEVLVKNKPETCPVCQGTGYLQRDGAFEVFEITDGVREMIKAQNWAGVKAELRKSGLPSIQQAALRKAVDGVTSVEEVLRITAEAAPAKPAAPKPAAKPTA
jgi:type II secretory ATPase GspE/PulE/Tfp pilus assembly ATPase PilB-like protein/branched-subunit amino acid transport protein